MALSLRMIVAGGGTGGHVFPGIALAEAFLLLRPDGAVSFVGTEEGLEARAVPARGFPIDFVPSGQVRGKGIGALPGVLRMALGGSQGARAINNRVLGMARRAKREGAAIRFLLQTGTREHEAVARPVREETLPVDPFPFTDRIGDWFPRCHAVLMRAGALSIAEAALFGRPCVLVPYPFAADDHQAGNAREFCASGAGVWMPEGEATEEALWTTLWNLGGDRAARERAGTAAVAFSRPFAAVDAVRAALRLSGKAFREGGAPDV